MEAGQTEKPERGDIIIRNQTENGSEKFDRLIGWTLLVESITENQVIAVALSFGGKPPASADEYQQIVISHPWEYVAEFFTVKRIPDIELPDGFGNVDGEDWQAILYLITRYPHPIVKQLVNYACTESDRLKSKKHFAHAETRTTATIQ